MLYRQSWISKLERKLPWLAIPNLMLILVGAMVIVFIMDYLVGTATQNSLWAILTFDRAAVAAGQFWRIVTFLFLPPSASILFAALALYFYWMIGSTLENQWGSFGFTLFYIVGAIGALIAGLISGYADNTYLNLSMFLAFALLYPDFTVMVFFIIPVKMKWLALLDAIGLVFSFIISDWSGKLAILFSLLNLIIFFFPNMIDRIKSIKRRIEWKRKFR